jgi:hypothetical protein
MEPDGAGGQVVARQHGQPAPAWSDQEEMSAWDFLHAELVAGLEHCEVGLGPKRVADRIMGIEAYVECGDSDRSDEQLGEDLDALLPDLMSLKAGVEHLQESLQQALLQAGEGRCLMQQVLELGVKNGKRDERALEGIKQDVLAFVRRVAGSASGRPEAEAKGSLALLAIVAAEILLQIAEWQDSVADWLALQSQREQGACADPCSADVEAAGLRRFDAECGVWRLVDDRWQAGNSGGLQPPFRPTAGLTPHRPMGARGPECLGEAPGAERQSCEEEVSCGPGQNGVFKESRCDEKVSKLYEVTLAVGLVESDERFSSFEFGFLGDELVRWEESGETCGHYPVEAVHELGRWQLEFLQHAEPLVKRVADLGVGLSQEQGRKAWAALESEMTALRLSVGGSGSPAGSDFTIGIMKAAGSFVRLAKVLDMRLLRVRGWGSALQAWRSASAVGRSGSRVQAGRGFEVRVGAGGL